MVLTDTERFSAGPSSGGCTGSVLTPSEDVAFITTIVNGLVKGKVITRLISIGQISWDITGHSYNYNLEFDKPLLVTVTQYKTILIV